MGLKEDLEALTAQAIKEIGTANGIGAVKELRVKYLGRKGQLTAVLKQMGGLSESERPEVGRIANESRDKIDKALSDKEALVGSSTLQASIAADSIDVSLPGWRLRPGHTHLITQIIEEITDIFIGLGYTVAEGPEVELDFYNFEALNTPQDHPARSLQDTFYIDSKPASGRQSEAVLLRTHTSPVQIRVMKNTLPPVYIIAPGKAYRTDYDITHTPMFHQVEGLAVDEDITFADLKGTLEIFVRKLFGEDRQIRLRPHFFPFTEPSAEVDVSCVLCNGSGCRACKGSGWLEILGAGMVDPNVFKHVGYDPEKVRGFAFGVGVERVAMLRHGLTDIRMLFENDVRFLRQF